MNIKSNSGTFSNKQIVYVTLSQLMLMMTHIIVSLTDLWAAGQIDTTVQASIGVVSQILAMMVLIMSVASGGTMAAISQSLGAKNHAKARRYANLVIALVFSVGTITSIVFYILLPLWVSIFATDPAIVKPFKTFATAYVLYLPFFYTTIIINTIFRAYKYVMMPFITTSLIAIVNVAGDLLFGLGYLGFPNFGYYGIAYSTFAGALVGVSFSIFMILRHGIIKNLCPPPLRWAKAAMPYLLKVSIPSSIGQLSGTISSFVILALLARLPNEQTVAVAGIVIGMRVEAFILFPLGAVAITLSMVSGHMIGARRYDELYSLGNKISLIIASISLLTGLLLFTFRDYVIPIFTSDSDVLRYSSYYIMLACVVLPLRSYASVTFGIFSGAGATLLTSRIAIISSIIVQIPIAYILSYPMGYGVIGVYIGVISSSIVSSILIIIEYRRKKWLDYGMKARR